MAKVPENIKPLDLPLCRTCSGACMFKVVGLCKDGHADVFCSKDVRDKK